MTDFSILHLSDLHYNNETKEDINIVINSLAHDIEDVRKNQLNGKIDFLIFSGDLVRSGEDINEFHLAKSNFLDRIITSASLNPENVLFVPGNHDISRDFVRTQKIFHNAIIEELTSTAAINDFITNKAISGTYKTICFDRLKNYESFISSLGISKPNTESLFYRTFIPKSFEPFRIGIACFNTAWLASGEGDEYGKLILGERNVDNALSDILGTDFKIAILHHPLDWLLDFDRRSVETLIIREFDLIFCGHTHTQNPEMRQLAFGSSVICQGGCLYQSRDYFNGYSFVQVKTTNRSVKIYLRTYRDTPARTFEAATNITGNPTGTFELIIPQRKGKTTKGPLERFLEIARTMLRTQANEHISIVTSGVQSKVDILTHFIPPPLGARAEIFGDEKVDTTKTTEKKISSDDLLRSRDNYIIFGAQESGKTTLGFFLAVISAEGTWDEPRAPLLVDFDQIRPGSDPLRRAIRHGFPDSLSPDDFNELVAAGQLLIIVDKLDSTDIPRLKLLQRLVVAHPKIRWIFLATTTHIFLKGNRQLGDLFGNFTDVFIQDLPRRSIRKLARQWADDRNLSEEIGDNTFLTVVEHIKKGNLPKSGYIATLLLWAIFSKKELEIINEAVLLENVLDFLLDKSDATDALRRKFDFASKTWLLQQLAVFLKERNGTCDYNDVLEFTIQLFHQKSLSNYKADEIIHYFIKNGILVENDGSVYFKYKGFQDFYLSGELHDQPELLEKVFTEKRYLSYAHEIDLLTSRYRRDHTILDKLRNDLSLINVEPIKAIQIEDFLKIHGPGPMKGITERQLQEMREKRISADEVDDLVDQIERRLSDSGFNQSQAATAKGSELDEDQQVSISSGYEFATTLALYGKVARNLEFIDGKIKEDAVGYFIDQTAKTILYLIGLIEEVITEAAKKEDEKVVRHMREAAEFFGKILIPILMGMHALQCIGTEKLIEIFIKRSIDNRQPLLCRILYSFILLDLQNPKYHDSMRKIIRQNTKNKYLIHVLTHKLYHIYRTRYLSERERDIMVNLIADLSSALTKLPRAARGHLISDIRDQAAPDE